MTLLIQNIKSRPVYILCLLFLLVNFMLFLKLGIHTELEAEKYIREGENLYSTGHLSASKYIFYLPIIALIYLSHLTGLGFEFVIVVQILLSGFAILSFYKLCCSISASIFKGFIAAAILCIFLPLQSWNFYLYSDSTFISLVIIFLSVVYYNADNGLKGIIKILLFLSVLIFSRPHGLLLIPPTFLYLVFRKQSKKERGVSIALAGIYTFIMYLLLNKAFKGGEDMDAMKPFIEEHIICFVPQKPEGAKLDLLNSANPVKNLLYYVLNNPLHYLKLMSLKIWSFFNITRPYYSTAHNTLLLFYIIPLYTFALVGFKKFCRIAKGYALFIAGLLILYPLGATLQCDDWHSRFTMVVIPSLVLIAIVGTSGLKKSKK